MAHSTRPRPLVIAVAATLALAASDPGSLQAQLNPFGTAGYARLQNSDLDLIDRAASKLYSAKDVPDGTSETWNNPVTGAKGSVTKEADFTTDFQGRTLPCRRLRYEVDVLNKQGVSTLRLSWCDDAGTWRLQ